MSDPVLELLQKEGIAFKVSGRDYVTKCLNPDHEDSNPSFRIDKVSGIAHCFSCGFKTNLFKYFGVFSNPIPIRVAKLKQKLADLKMSMNGVPLPQGAVPYTKSFRGISSNTLKHFEAFYTTQTEALIDRIIFPIKDITGKTVVYVGRHLLSNGNPRYLNYPSKVQIPVFPASVPAGHKSIILVEGIFDMLNLYDNGIDNVVCTFGTNTLQNDTKMKLFPFKAQGISHVYLLFDGDEAGERAAYALKPLLEELEFIVEIITLPEGMDPGELSKEEIASIKEYTDK